MELFFAFKEKSKQEEFYYRTDMERMRLQTMLLINVHIKKEKQFKSPKRFLPFPWDEDEYKNPKDVQKQSVDEMKGVLMALAGSSKNIKKKNT